MENENDVPDWWASPQTRKFIEITQQQASNAALELEKACRESTDPAVRGAFIKWKTLIALAESMGKRTARAA